MDLYLGNFKCTHKVDGDEEGVGRGGRAADCSLLADGPGRPGRHTPCHVVSLHVITFGGAVDQ